MKRVLIILLLAFALVLTACGGGEEPAEPPKLPKFASPSTRMAVKLT